MSTSKFGFLYHQNSVKAIIDGKFVDGCLTEEEAMATIKAAQKIKSSSGVEHDLSEARVKQHVRISLPSTREIDWD